MKFTAKLILLLAAFASLAMPYDGNGLKEILAAESQQPSLSSIVQQASPAVVLIEGRKETPVRTLHYEWHGEEAYLKGIEESTVETAVSFGSGFFVSPDGHVVTNKHVVSDEKAKYVVNTGAEEFSAEILYRDPDYDLAVLKVDGEGFPALALDSSDIDVGDPVVAMGNSLGRYIDSASPGLVSELEQDIEIADGIERRGRRWVRSMQELADLIETSAKVYPGDSGGPLLNTEGKVVGVNVATARGVRVGYAIPAEAVKDVLRRAGV